MLDSLFQSAVLLVVSALAGVGVGVAAGSAIGSTGTPFALEVAPIATATVLLVVLGMAGASAAVVRIARVDPPHRSRRKPMTTALDLAVVGPSGSGSSASWRSPAP